MSVTNLLHLQSKRMFNVEGPLKCSLTGANGELKRLSDQYFFIPKAA